MDNEEKPGASLEFVVPKDLADGFVNNKKECYRFRLVRDQDVCFFLIKTSCIVVKYELGTKTITYV